MEKYEYKVEYCDIRVTSAEVYQGTAGKKIIAQVEVKLREWADKGYEFYSQSSITFTIQPGCGEGKQATTREALVLVFRKPLS